MSVKLSWLAAGYCTQSEHMLFSDGARKTIQFPAGFALLEHATHGPILFDTGYSERFFTATQRFPYNLYRKVTPVYVQLETTARQQLAARGIAATNVRAVIISHFHADHVCGLADFPNARYLYFADAYTAVQHRRGLNALRAGFLSSLLPSDFDTRAQPLSPDQMQPLSGAYAPFDRGVDLLGDGSLIAVCIPGHAAGQMALFVQTANDGRAFLVADGCWHSRSYREHILPNPIVRLIFHNWPAYAASFAQICQFHRAQPQVPIFPSHCSEIGAKF